MNEYPQRGQVYWVVLDPTIGSEIAKTRPALIISNNAGNQYASRVIVAPITSKVSKVFPFEVKITLNDVQGKILLDQIRAIDKRRIKSIIATVESDTMQMVDQALKVVLALN